MKLNYQNLWPQGQIDRLTVLAGEGRSATQIAAAMNQEFRTSFSRSAIIGKLSRIKVALISTDRPKRPRKPRTVKPKPPAKRLPVIRLRTPEEEAQERAVADLPLDSSPFAVTLIGLTKDTCRWPIGDPQSPDFVFCGAKPFGCQPYCTRHSRAAYQPPQSRSAKAPFRTS